MEYSRKVIERGRTYLNEGRVLSVIPDPERKVWHAEVLGSELYLVDLDATAKEIDYCQCPYWEEHHYCKHTIAVELYLRKQGKTRQITEEKSQQKPHFRLRRCFLRDSIDCSLDSGRSLLCKLNIVSKI